ncbi:MAG: hypothetical protein WCH79_19220, partial [Planctomycetia bacterium]
EAKHARAHTTRQLKITLPGPMTIADTVADALEGEILRRVFPHSLALAALMGLLVWLQAGPLSWMVPTSH